MLSVLVSEPDRTVRLKTYAPGRLTVTLVSSAAESTNVAVPVPLTSDQLYILFEALEDVPLRPVVEVF
jgi:hypothetical protein